MELPHLHLFPIILLLLLSPLRHTSKNGFTTFPLPPAAAPGPVLQNHPFIVVWNLPTANCQQRYDIHLDLDAFHIVANPEQRFQGEIMSIFYRDQLGMYPYLSQDGLKVNGGIPQLGDLEAHLALTASQLSVTLRPNFTGLAVIDWEEWQPVWERNTRSKMEYRRLSKLLVRQQRPDLSEKAVTLMAKQQFEENAQRFMEETLRSAVRDYPKGLWGFYGFPLCFNKNKRKKDKTYTGRCHRGTRQQNEQLSWLWSQSTALYPSIYLPQRLAGAPDAALMVRNRVLEALRVAALWRPSGNSATPVLPYARLAFTHTLTFLNKTDLEHTLGESAALGASGVVLWGESKFAKSKEKCMLLRDYIHNVLGPYIQSLRSDTQRCSLQRCHGQGRCTRRHRSGRRPSSAAVPDWNDVRLFNEHFMCQCSPGWTGRDCQEEEKKSE